MPRKYKTKKKQVSISNLLILYSADRALTNIQQIFNYIQQIFNISSHYQGILDYTNICKGNKTTKRRLHRS